MSHIDEEKMLNALATFKWPVVWDDQMITEYYDSHPNATIHEICAFSGRSKADVKRALLNGGF